MTDILWIASYPKSGNTWVRIFLHNYLLDTKKPHDVNRLTLDQRDTDAHWFRGLTDGEPTELGFEAAIELRGAAQQAIAASRPGSVLVKTHMPVANILGHDLISVSLTAGAIYVVRNPLDVCLSLAHFWGCPIDEAIDEMASVHLKAAPDPGKVWDFYGGWAEHAESWAMAPLKARLILRYEDLSADPTVYFGQLVYFLEGRAPDADRLARAIEHSGFTTVQAIEREKGFRGQSAPGRAFFRSGRAGAWRDVLSDSQIDRIIARHGRVMKIFSYLDE